MSLALSSFLAGEQYLAYYVLTSIFREGLLAESVGPFAFQS